jgi:hypothetical protein
MSNDLIPYGSNELTMRDRRQLGRAVSRNHAGALVRVSGTDAETDIVLAKIDNYTMAVGQGMVSVARIGQMQRQCELQAPELSGRLNYLAEGHLMGVDALLGDYQRDLRRW